VATPQSPVEPTDIGALGLFNVWVSIAVKGWGVGVWREWGDLGV
jgi:hypothetical protein